MIDLDQATYERRVHHGYAGPLRELGEGLRARYVELGADAWVLILTSSGTALTPARVLP